MMNVTNTAKAFGCHDVVLLGSREDARHIDYLDLLRVSGRGSLKVGAVAEFQANPFLYLVSNDGNGDLPPQKVTDLQSLLANRGERAYLGILSPGELKVYPVNFRSSLPKGGEITIQKSSPDAPLFFQSLVSGTFNLGGQPEASDFVFKKIHTLLTRSSDFLIEKHQLDPLDTLSFLGRALFFRFLWDRKIILPRELSDLCPQAGSPGECFANIQNSIATCLWLDDTFNGDLLPLSGAHSKVFGEAGARTKGELFLHLQAIVEGWEHVGDSTFQQEIDWNDLDFAHIPIGVLSQVYEHFSRVWDRQAKKTSVYYTPRNIARTLVDDAFEGVKDKRNAQILDPSCGAGIFLVLAFRKLVAARWNHDGKRPDTRTIQSILYKQIRGFDVSESALRLAALSLYITAIELNGTPRPPKSLKFPEPLQGRVLHNQRGPEEKGSHGFVLGSLRPGLSEEFNGRFDVVVGNPPWSRLKGETAEEKKTAKALSAKFTGMTREILKERGLSSLAGTYHNPDNNPDLPFLWRSTQWAKEGGVIAMALPGRIFLKQSPAGVRAFNAILEGIEITGILNGSNLSDTEVWPGMNQPFILFYGRNRVPSAQIHFHFVTPHFERYLNEKGRVRIDYQSAQPVASRVAVENPYLLKALSVGTSLDVEVMGKLNELEWGTVQSYWEQNGLYSGLGYNLSPNLSQKDAAFMKDLPDFAPPDNGAFKVSATILQKFGRSTAHRPRDPELYQPPLLIVPQSPGPSFQLAKSYIFHEAVAFNQSCYGFSANGFSDPSPVALIHLLSHSELFRYHVLMTSSRMGAERRTFLKKNIENFPFPPIESWPKQQRKTAIQLSNRLETSQVKPWDEINDFIFDLYGLDKYDRQVVRDTLAVSAPFKESRDRANGWPSIAERRAFRTELKRLLAPSFQLTNEKIFVEEVDVGKQNNHAPWYFFSVTSSSSGISGKADFKALIPKIAGEANKTGCSRAVASQKDCLLIGIIGQYRYWTLSRARLCALDILRNYLDFFPIGKSQ